MRKPNIKHKNLILLVLVFSSFLVLGVVFIPWTSPVFAETYGTLKLYRQSGVGFGTVDVKFYRVDNGSLTLIGEGGLGSSAYTLDSFFNTTDIYAISLKYNSYYYYLYYHINGYYYALDSSSASNPFIATSPQALFCRNTIYSSTPVYSYFSFNSDAVATPTPSPTPTPVPTASPLPLYTPFATPSENQQAVFNGSSYNPLNVTYSHDGINTSYTYTVDSYRQLYANSPYTDNYFVFNNNEDISSLSYSLVDVVIPYAFYGWNGGNGQLNADMFCSFKIAFPEAYVLPENSSACLYLCNSEGTHLAYIPLTKAEYFNIFYCDSFSVPYLTFDHIKFEMLLVSSEVKTLGIDYISLGTFVITQDSVPYSELAGEINRIINNGMSGSQNAVINWVEGKESEMWDNATSLTAILYPYMSQLITIATDGAVYVTQMRPAVRLTSYMLSEFWDSLGAPLQLTIVTLVVVGVLGTLAGFGASVASKTKNGGDS